MLDIIVIGAGPAGLTAALYSRRAGKSVLIIEKSTFGGQITHSPRVENYPGFPVLSGTELADKLVEQVLSQGADIELDAVTSVEKTEQGYRVVCESGEYTSKAVIIATGSHHRKLGIDREDEFVGEGISYCAVCDGAFYKDKSVAIIGGGNTALQEAVMLSDICSEVTVVQNLDFLTGEKMLVEEIEKKDNVKVILSSTVEKIIADNDFKGITINKNGEMTDLLCDGVFVAIGQVPENEPFADLVELNDYGYISAGEDCLPKSRSQGVFVAGDCRTKAVRQVTTASADGAVSALAACRYIDSL